MAASLFPNLPKQTPAPTQAAQVSAAPSSLAPLTQDEVKNALPTTLRTAVTQQLVDHINNISKDPIIAETIRDNVLGYTAILKDGKFKTEDYVNAVAYVSYKLMGNNNEEAYAKTFPTRYATLVAKGADKKTIAAYVTAYNKGKLVNLILEQTLVPTWVLNQDIYQEAINTQATLMRTAQSEKVRTDAANSLLTHLKKPEGKDFQISLDVAESAGMKEMKDAVLKMAELQQKLIADGAMKTVDVAASRLIDRENATDV